MFWGLIMEPNKRYTQKVEKPFHISQASMDISTGDNEPCQVMVVVSGKNFLVCTLQKNKSIQVPLDLYFKGDSVSFLSNGKCNIHLTGYLDPDYEEDDVSDEEMEDEEAPELVAPKNKRKLDNATNNLVNNKKLKLKQDTKKILKKSTESDSSDEDDDGDDKNNQLLKLLDGEDIETDDNDESFKINTSADASDDSDEEDDNEEEAEDEEEDDDDDDDEEEEEDAQDNEAEVTKDSSDEAETTLDTSQDSKPDGEQKLSRSQRRKLKKKQQQQQKALMNGVDKPKEKQDGQQKQRQKGEKKEENNKQAEKTIDKKEKKTLNGGVFIEDLKVGSGPAAKAGKVVQVYYEGRLKQNNKMFDNCNKGPGFKFRLGSKEVISGWDVGVAGMKVGGKRKIVCPPAMAYGAKGSPPVIPPNSSLIFEVELKNVK